MHHHSAASGLAALTAIWFAMMAVMMVPAVWPWIRSFHRFNAAASTMRGTAQFSAGYLAAWFAYSLVAACLQRTAVPVMAAWSASAMLALAGLYQFAPLKRACLTHCRSPFTYFLSRWRSGRAAAFQMGLHHGIFCVGCCWAMMATMLAVGVTNVLWMIVLAAVAALEQAWRHGGRLRAPIGFALILAAVVQLTLR